jgi:basic membrane protein A
MLSKRSFRASSCLIAAFALCGVLLFGCSKEPEKPQDAQTSAPAPSKSAIVGVSYDVGGRKDMSFNYGVSLGVDKARKEFHIKTLEVDSRNQNDYEPNMHSMIEQGADLVFSIGIHSKATVEKVAREHPNKKFAFVDGVIDLPNVRSIVFDDAAGSFLVGYLAGLVTKTGKVGFVGGVQIPLIVKFYSGYAAGVKTANPKATVLPPKYIGGWENIDLGKTAATYLYAQGADIVYQAAGRAGLGVLGAAKANKKYAIGVDSDQDHIHPGHVLTSMIKAVDESSYQTIKDFVEGKFTSGVKVYGLKENGVRLSPMKYTRHLVGEQNLAKIEEVRQKIIKGEIKVPTTEAELKTYLTNLEKQ